MIIKISQLNNVHPIKNSVWGLADRTHIEACYSRLGIIDYNDYLFNHNHYLQNQFAMNPALQSKVSSLVLSDIIQQKAHLIADLGEEVIKDYLDYLYL